MLVWEKERMDRRGPIGRRDLEKRFILAMGCCGNESWVEESFGVMTTVSRSSLRTRSSRSPLGSCPAPLQPQQHLNGMAPGLSIKASLVPIQLIEKKSKPG
jgi:hypothetical protein